MCENVWSCCGLSTSANELSSFVWKPKNLKNLRKLKNLRIAKTENPVFPRVFEFFRKLENLKTVKIEISETFEVL
jgi:hypothetical protein